MGKATLLGPVPKEYSTYTDIQKMEKTEIFYRQMEKIYQNVDEIKAEYFDRVEKLLKEEAGVSALKDILEEKEAWKLCDYSNVFYALRFLCRVAQLEEAFNEPNALQNIHSMNEVFSWVQESIFWVRRFEYERVTESSFFLMIQQKKISYIWLAEIICEDWIVRKVSTCCRVARYLFNCGETREAILLLMFLEKKLPYSDRKIMSFSLALLEMGEYTLAHTVLMKHQNSDEETIELQRELGMML